MSSPSSPVIVRPRRTYGRRATSEHDSSFDTADTSIDSRDDHDFSHSTSIDLDHPPTSDPPDASNTSPVSERASDEENSVAGNQYYKYAWRDQLKAIDDSYTEDVSNATGRLHVDPMGASATRPTTPSDRDHDAFGGSLSSLTNSSPPAPSVARSSASFRSRPLPALDYGSDHDDRPSTPQSPSHTLGTPRSRSSSTPPTSIEMPPKKGKGKAKAVEPLRYDNDDQSASGSELAKARDTKGQKRSQATDKRAKIKRPTKKDMEDAKKFTARMAAKQSASIASAPAPQNFRLSSFLQRFEVPKPQPKRSRTPPMPSTDPIESFSSSPHAVPPEPTRRPSTSTSKPAQTSFEHTGLLEGMKSDSDPEEDMPTFQQLQEQQRRQRELEAQQQQLRAFKEKQAQEALQGRTASSDDDSELEIVDSMETVARDEAQARRGAIARGEIPSVGSKKQLAAAGPSARRERVTLGDTKEVWRELKVAAQPVFAKESKPRKAEVPMSPRTLNLWMRKRADEQARELRRKKEEEWLSRGGRIKEQPGAIASATKPLDSLADVLEQRRLHREAQRAGANVVHESDSDEDWKPDENQAWDEDGPEDAQHSDAENRVPGPSHEEADGQADDEDDEENPFHVPRQPPRRARATIESGDEGEDDDDTENHPLPQQSRGRKLVRDSTWVRGSHSPSTQAQPLVHRESISSLGDLTDGTRTEDGTDKENDASLSFDRGEDKENTVIAVQSPAARLGRFGSLFASDIAASPSGSVGRGAPDGVRSPLKELPAEDDDPFAFTPGPPLRLGGPGRDGGSLEASPMNLGAGAGLEPAFSLSPTGSRKGKARARSTSPSPLGEALDLGGGLGGGLAGGGFSQFFTQQGNARDFNQLKAAQGNDDIALTAEPGLQAALDVSSTWRKKADEIFEKEQEQIALQEQANAQKDPEPEMFVDANGFLTQTRPSLVSPISARTPLHFNTGVRFSSPRSVLSSLRKPLEDLPTQDSDDEDADLPPRRRLFRRNDSPEPVLQPPSKLNAWNVLRRLQPQKAQRPTKLDKSEFIQGEAEESDEEAGFGFGPKKANDEEEEEDEDQDRVLEELVDDKEMDDKTLAEEKVLEKVREHQEADDKALEKVHLDAVQGRLRTAKRGRRGLDLSDSDSESDEEARRVRAKLKKARNPQTIAALEKDPDTKAFAHAYSANTVDDGEEFTYLRRDDDKMDIDGDAAGGSSEEEEGDENSERPMAISAAQLREELRAAAEQGKKAQVFDPEDVSWADRDPDDEDEMELESRVREVSAEAPNPHGPNAASGALQAKSNVIDAATPAHLLQWAKAETTTRTGGIIGRSAGGSVAVTGHGKTKGGNGSFKGPRAASSSGAAKTKPVTKQASMLSAVPSFSKRSKFGN